jgi:vacuolar-type H+-ATPase subunit H
MVAIAIQNRDTILERVSKGDKIADIAKDYGITQAAISKQLLDDPEWTEARRNGALSRIEKWEKEIEGISADTNQVMLGRAKEMLSHARWRAEREFPAIWGQQKQNINIITGVSMDDVLSSTAGELLEGVVIKD